MSLDRVVVRLLVAIVAVDVALALVNLGSAPAFLDLDEEQNFTTWYSSAKLLGAALAALACWRLEPVQGQQKRRPLIWPLVALVFAALSVDETATAHERLAAAIMSGDRGVDLRNWLLGGDAVKDAFAWPVLFAPVVLGLVGFLAAALYARMKNNRRSLYLGIGGCAAFLAAVVLEGAVVYTTPPIAAWGDAEVARYALVATFEELAEVLGTTLVLASLLLHALRLRKNP